MSRTVPNNYPSCSGINKASLSQLTLSKLCLGGEIVQVPTALIEEEALFRAVITKDAFRSLSSEAQNYLKRFLPKYEGSDKDEEKILDTVFTADPNLYFGNPLGKLHAKIRRGWFNPERPSDQVQLRDNRRVLYDHYIRHYYMTLLKSLLISRHKEFARHASLSAADEPSTSKMPATGLFRKTKIAKRIRRRAEARLSLMFKDVRKKVGEEGECLSSDEEESDDSSKVSITRSGQSTLFSPEFIDYDLHQPIYMDDVKRMLKDYKNLKEQEPDSPSLDISDIGIENVYERAGVACIAEKNLSAEVSEAMKLPFKPMK